MKEATGELNMTLITVVAIAAVAAIFYTVVWPIIKENISNSAKCPNAVCTGQCIGGRQTCTYQGETISCPCEVQ